ncbi:MAG TPA: hypothetical protein VK017_08410 [Sphingobacterium sp.]|nr:hypothetical protein [Sphingobacterium sp.]
MDTFRHLQQPTGRKVWVQGREYLFFGGTAYLGLLVDPDYIEIYKNGIHRYGLNNGTSRSNNVQLAIYEEVESHLAKRFGMEQCLVLSSGYLAAQLCIQQLKRLGQVLYAPGAHPALWDGEASVPKSAFSSWAGETVGYINRSPHDSFVIVTNTFDNLTPAVHDFSPFDHIAEDKQIYFLLDDSHGIGVQAAYTFAVNPDRLRGHKREVVVVASLAKGMGTDAGAIFCSQEMASLFRNSPIFSGASPSSPASLYALIAGEWVYRRQVERLQQNISRLQVLLGAGFTSIPAFPVFTVGKVGAFDDFLQQNILISSFPYPSAKDPTINRIVLSALHQQEDIERLGAVASAIR